MRLPTGLRRLGFRSAYALLRVYWFVRRPRMTGVKCVLTSGERVLLVCHTYGRDEWDLPGGGVKRKEEPLHAAQREMEEELGVSIKQWVPLGQMFGHVDHRRDTLHCFQAELTDGRVTVDRGELAEAEWFAIGELPPQLGRYVRPILARTRGARAGEC